MIQHNAYGVRPLLSPLRRWMVAINMALQGQTYDNVRPNGRDASTWQYGPETNYVLVTVQSGRVVSCSCGGAGGGPLADNPCIAAVSVAMYLHRQAWAQDGMDFEWGPIASHGATLAALTLIRSRLPEFISDLPGDRPSRGTRGRVS